jgi:NitT/TauT family transport system ATP-binding protein
MDEPFSALDVLTAENLRGELVSLWSRPEFATRALCIVTHNIEEAVLLADRVMVLGSNPGRIKAEVPISLQRPRDRHSAAFESLVDQLYGILTDRDQQPVRTQAAGPLNQPLPAATVGGVSGLLDMVNSTGGRTDLSDLADELSFEVDDLLPLVDAASLLGLLEVSGAAVALTDTGRAWCAGDIQQRKELWADAAQTHAPLVRTIVTGLRNSAKGTLREDFFRDLLRRGYSADDTELQLDIAIGWGRYGELYDFDADSGELHLDTAVAPPQRVPVS